MTHWGWLDNTLELRRRVCIARAVCRQVAYDHGYEQPITHSMILSWEKSLGDAVTNGSENVANDVLSPIVGCSKRYFDSIEGMCSMIYWCASMLNISHSQTI